MKTKHLYTFTLLAFIFIFLNILAYCALFNYVNAINEAKRTDGADAEIEKIMLKYGFDIDANDQNEPTMYAKIQALLK